MVKQMIPNAFSDGIFGRRMLLLQHTNTCIIWRSGITKLVLFPCHSMQLLQVKVRSCVYSSIIREQVHDFSNSLAGSMPPPSSLLAATFNFKLIPFSFSVNQVRIRLDVRTSSFKNTVLVRTLCFLDVIMSSLSLFSIESCLCSRLMILVNVTYVYQVKSIVCCWYFYSLQISEYGKFRLSLSSLVRLLLYYLLFI